MGPKAPKATRHALRRSNYSFTQISTADRTHYSFELYVLCELEQPGGRCRSRCPAAANSVIAQLLDVGIRRGHLRVARAMPTLPARAAARGPCEDRGARPARRPFYVPLAERVRGD